MGDGLVYGLIATNFAFPSHFYTWDVFFMVSFWLCAFHAKAGGGLS